MLFIKLLDMLNVSESFGVDGGCCSHLLFVTLAESTISSESYYSFLS